jgi:hypothetical protein
MEKCHEENFKRMQKCHEENFGRLLAGQQRLLELFGANPTNFEDATECEYTMDLFDQCEVLLPIKTTDELKKLNDFVLKASNKDARNQIVSSSKFVDIWTLC